MTKAAMRTPALTFILTLGLTLFLLWAPNPLVNFEEPIFVATPSLSGFEEVKTGVFRAVKTQNEFHLLNTPIALVPNAYYRIRYDISHLPREKVMLAADLYAPGYDSPEQELDNIVGMSNLGMYQDFIFNSGKPPAHALFRLFYTGAQGLEVANIQIRRVPAWSIWLKRVMLTGALGTFLIFIMMAIKRVLNLTSLSRQSEISTSGIRAKEMPVVIAIYLVAVLIRFSIYIVLPYWSGDEYVYKSIAAGIWHFGHYGKLTDSMIGNSVEMPNLLYPYLISPAFILKGNFYFGVRLINAIVINMAIFPCYLLARKYLNQTPALIAAIFAIAIPFVNLGAFAVTEVLFFPLFLLSVWIAVESIDRRKSIGWAIGFGVVSGVLLNVRLNAMILLPAYLFSLLWISLRRKQLLSLLSRPYWLGATIAFLCTYVSLKYSLDGKAIGDFGFYAAVAERSEGPFSIIAKNPAGIFHLIAGHLTTLSIPYALPIALIVTTVGSSRSRLTIDDKFNDFLVITTIFSSALFVLGLIFTISVSPFDLGGLGRWHSRYYFYFYPLIIIAGVVFADRLQFITSPNRFWVIVVIVLLLACNIYFIKVHNALQNPWFGSIADNMDVQWYRSAGQFYWFFAVFTVLLSWLWYKRSAYFAGGLVCFMIAWAVVANYGTLRAAGAGTGPQSDTCGNLSQHFIDRHPGRFVVVGDSRATMVGAAFWNPYIPEKTFMYTSGSKLLGPAEVGIATDYLVVNGSISVDPAYRPRLSIGKCAIYEMPN
ncbi:MAG: glycosyltransferase family 39 protein [Sulfuriferula sp.]